VLIDGLKAARELVDARTDLDNALKTIPEAQPKTRLVGPKLATMDKCITTLDVVLNKLRKQFQKMNNSVDNMEQVLYEAHKVKGWQWVHEHPLWVTWSLEMFVTRIAELLPTYNRSLNVHIELVDLLRSHSVTFEVSRDAINKWVEQAELEDTGWKAVWEDIFEVEVEHWK
jgi:hypothetical protein